MCPMTTSRPIRKKQNGKGKPATKGGGQQPQSQPQVSQSASVVSLGRHAHQCTICSHPQLDEIDLAFVNWASPSELSREYSVSRDAIYRHARALNLIDVRRRNVRAALERIIERAGEVEVNAAAVVSAVSAYAKINGRGELVERSQTVNLNALFERMSADELERYARDGALPGWFDASVAATGTDSRGGSNEL
jgi:hypothetical protein